MATKEDTAMAEYKHGHAGNVVTPEYDAWMNMRYRCYKKDHANYADYGGRGITVCDRWKGSFTNFIKDMGRKPTGLHTLERLDNDKGYSPENCVWGTQKDQLRNTRRNRLITCNGKTQCLSAWAEETGVRAGAIRKRIVELGWPVEKALYTPTESEAPRG